MSTGKIQGKQEEFAMISSGNRVRSVLDKSNLNWGGHDMIDPQVVDMWRLQGVRHWKACDSFNPYVNQKVGIR